jgi:hypothetical protein
MDPKTLEILMEETRKEQEREARSKAYCKVRDKDDCKFKKHIEVPMDFDEVNYEDDDSGIMLMAAGIAEAFDVNVAGAIMGAAILSGD